MGDYLTPGVYVEEIDRGPRPIQGVGTATAAFVGFTEKAQLVERRNGETITTDLLNRPQLVTNWTQYVERFGGFVSGAYLPQAVYGYFQNGGSRCYVVSARTMPKANAALLGDDGKPHLVVRAKQAGYDGMSLRVRVEATCQAALPGATAEGEEEGDEPKQPSNAPFTVVVERQTASGDWIMVEERRNVSLQEVETRNGKQVRVAYGSRAPEWVDLEVPNGSAPLERIRPRVQQQSLNITETLLNPPSPTEFQGEATERTGVEGLEAIDDITMVCVPDLMAAAPGATVDLDMVKAVQTMIIAHCERMGDRVAVLDVPPHMKPQAIKKWRMDVAGYDSSYAALYYPWIEVSDPVTHRPTHVPPSGHVAGIWARNDNTRGVHKAPANEIVLGATGLAYSTTKGEQATLNPIGVNCIRAFPGRGIRVWGARTLSSNPAWRYINVRRLFNYVEKSIELSTQWVVFEPNDHKLWARVRRDVVAFLTTVWRDGALFGLSPNEAFYVKCDEENNPPESRDQGRLIIEIGLAPVKPAEFVIFRISQWAGPNAE